METPKKKSMFSRFKTGIKSTFGLSKKNNKNPILNTYKSNSVIRERRNTNNTKGSNNRNNENNLPIIPVEEPKPNTNYVVVGEINPNTNNELRKRFNSAPRHNVYINYKNELFSKLNKDYIILINNLELKEKFNNFYIEKFIEELNLKDELSKYIWNEKFKESNNYLYLIRLFGINDSDLKESKDYINLIKKLGLINDFNNYIRLYSEELYYSQKNNKSYNDFAKFQLKNDSSGNFNSNENARKLKLLLNEKSKKYKEIYNNLFEKIF